MKAIFFIFIATALSTSCRDLAEIRKTLATGGNNEMPCTGKQDETEFKGICTCDYTVLEKCFFCKIREKVVNNGISMEKEEGLELVRLTAELGHNISGKSVNSIAVYSLFGGPLEDANIFTSPEIIYVLKGGSSNDVAMSATSVAFRDGSLTNPDVCEGISLKYDFDEKKKKAKEKRAEKQLKREERRRRLNSLN